MTEHTLTTTKKIVPRKLQDEMRADSADDSVAIIVHGRVDETGDKTIKATASTATLQQLQSSLDDHDYDTASDEMKKDLVQLTSTPINVVNGTPSTDALDKLDELQALHFVNKTNKEYCAKIKVDGVIKTVLLGTWS